MVTEVSETVSFNQRLALLTAEEWARVQSPAAAWDSAWEHALSLGAVSVAVPAMAIARRAGASQAAAALAGAAAAAIDLEALLGPDDFMALFAPLARVIPRSERSLRAWGSTGAA